MNKYARALKKVSVEFCSKTSIHGMKYIIEPGRSFGERVFWIIMALISLAIALGLIFVVFMEGYNKAIRESIMSHNYPTWLLPFPAITLCNTNRISRSRAMNFIKSLSYHGGIKYEDLVEETKVLLYIMGYNANINISNLRSPEDSREPISLKQLFRIQDILDKNNKSYEQAMYELSQPCSELAISCSARGQSTNCLQMFQQSKTYYGLCCSFNYYSPTPDTSKLKYQNNKGGQQMNDAPFMFGSGFGISLLLDSGGAGDYFAPTYSSEGINVLLHCSTNYPSELELQSTVPIGKEAFLRVVPVSRFVADNLRSMSPSSRNCFFDDEVQLKYFSNYSFENCLLESKIDYIMSTCQCLPFTYPNIDVWANWSRENVIVKIKGKEIRCLEECISYTYMVTTTVGGLEAVQHNRMYLREAVASNIDRETAMSYASVLHVYLGSQDSLRLFRQYSFDFNNQLSIIGGIFGIAFGSSVISLLEMLYFFTIRFFQYVRNENKVKVKVRTVNVIPYRN